MPRPRGHGRRAPAHVSVAGVWAPDAPGPRPASHALLVWLRRGPCGEEGKRRRKQRPRRERGSPQTLTHPDAGVSPRKGLSCRRARRVPSLPRLAGARERRPLQAGSGRGRSRLVTGPGRPQARRAGAGRARPGGRRPRTHITGRGPGPHPGSPGGDRRGAGPCRPTRSLPAKRGSPWRRRRRRLGDRLPALAPGPHGFVEVAAAAAAARLVSANSRRSSAADGGRGGVSRPRPEPRPWPVQAPPLAPPPGRLGA